MKTKDFDALIERSVQIREQYHQLELKYHELEWTVSEDALAFLSDAGLIGRLVMAQQQRWPKAGDTLTELEHKLGECLWWLIVLAKRMDIDVHEALDGFLSDVEKQLME